MCFNIGSDGGRCGDEIEEPCLDEHDAHFPHYAQVLDHPRFNLEAMLRVVDSDDVEPIEPLSSRRGSAGRRPAAFWRRKIHRRLRVFFMRRNFYISGPKGKRGDRRERRIRRMRRQRLHSE